MTLDDLRVPLKVWVHAVTGFLCVWADDNSPQPAPPFARLRFSHSDKQMMSGDRRTVPANSDGVTTFVNNPRNFTLDCQFFGTGAIVAAQALEDAKDSDATQSLLYQDQIETVTVTAAAA